MSRTKNTPLNSFIAQAEVTAICRAKEESGIAQLVNAFPPDVSDEVFTLELRKKYQCKKLRAACTQLGLHPQADPSMNHKSGYITLLSQYRRSRQRGEVFTGYPKSRTKPTKPIGSGIEVDGRTKHCGFKLINVLFSPAFIARMVESGALPLTGNVVDATDGRAKYWKDVATAYANGDPKFDTIAGPPGKYEGIDPRIAPRHSSAKLCSIWKDMTTRYEQSIGRWKQLETKDVDFDHFCTDVDVLYLYDKLQIQPIQANLEQLKGRKRARMGDVAPESENASIGADSDIEEHLVKRGNFLIPSAVEVPMQCQSPSAGDFQGPMYCRILPTPSPEPARIQRQHFLASSKGQASLTRQNSRTLEDSTQPFLAAKTERRSGLETYDGVIYSSQAVRDTMTAIEALKRGNYDRAVIDQAKESLDAIVQVWLRELNKAGQARAPSST